MCHFFVTQKYNSSVFFQTVKKMLKLFREILNKTLSYFTVSQIIFLKYLVIRSVILSPQQNMTEMLPFFMVRKYRKLYTFLK